MLHFATAHHKSADWIAIQRDYLDRYVNVPFEVWGSLEGVDASFEHYFDHVVPSLGQHPGKLNLLGSIICDNAAPDDVVVFLDGDAFPVADLATPLLANLAASPLTAVQRLESDGDPQPQACFCATTVGFWRSLPGDWATGHVFRPGQTGVGANLLHRLEARATPWTPILRTHSIDVHPVLFGVYGGFLYHHGAGFHRLKTSLGDRTPAGLTTSRKLTIEESLKRERMQRHKNDPRYEAGVERALFNQALSETVYASIVSDRDFFVRHVCGDR